MMNWFLSPLSWLFLAALLVVASWGLRRIRTWLLAIAGVLSVVAIAAMTPVVANALVAPLERPMQVPRWCDDAPPSTAVVLGGGAGRLPRDATDDFAALNLASRRRMDIAVAWWREGEGRVLVLVGGTTNGGAATISSLMAAYGRMSGVPSASLRLESKSGDTWENALMSARLVPRLPERVVLVTSAMHMPRAQLAFDNAGFEICPLAGDFRKLPSRLPWALMPRSSALARTEAALHEWAGVAYYRWRARDL